MLRTTSFPLTLQKRRGAAAVELALVLPLFFSLAFIGIESGHALNVVQKLETAVRDGGRLAAKDIDPAMLQSGQTANQKVISDITNMLKAEGIPGSSITVTITHADGANVGQVFDLSLTSNQYKLMKIYITVPYADVGMFPMSISPSKILNATLVISRGRSTLNL